MLDRLDGGIAHILSGKARLTTDEASRTAHAWLDAFDRRPTPTSTWSGNSPDSPCPGTGDVPTQRRLFAQVEPAARQAGHGTVLDAWDKDLDLMRPQ